MTARALAAIAALVWQLGSANSNAAPPSDVTIVAPPALAAEADRIRRVDMEQLSSALGRAGLELPPHVQITLLPDDDPRAQRVPRWFAGLAIGGDIVIFPERVASYPYDSIETVFRHEIVHVALDARAGGQPLPRWFHEGTATAVESGWTVVDRVRLLAATATAPAVEDVARLFESPAEPQTTHAYLLAAALMDELRRAHGAALPGRIAAEVGRGVPFDQAFASQTGVTPNEAARDAWRSYRRWTSWVPAATDPASTWSLILALAFVAFFVRMWKRARRRRQWDDEEADPIP